MTPIKRDDLVRGVSKRTGLTFRDSRVVLNAVFDTVADLICNEKGERVFIAEFGTFVPRRVDDYDYFDSSTGQTVHVSGFSHVNFRASKILLSRLDPKRYTLN